MGIVKKAREWWKLASVKAMAFWSALGGVIVMMWPVAQWGFNQILPDNIWWRSLFAIATVAVTFSSMLYARLKPGKPND